MAGTITTTVRGGRSKPAAIVFTLVNALTSAAVGWAIAVLGSLVPVDVLLTIAVPTCTFYLFYFVAHGRVPFPGWPPQLPSRWLELRHPMGTAVRYGVMWGLAFSTPIRAGSLIGLAIMTAAVGDPRLGMASFGVVGMLRAMEVTIAAFRESEGEPGESLRRLDDWRRPLVGALDSVVLAAFLGIVLQVLFVS